MRFVFGWAFAERARAYECVFGERDINGVIEQSSFVSEEIAICVQGASLRRKGILRGRV